MWGRRPSKGGGVNIPDILPKNNHEIEDDLDRCDQKGIIKS